MSDGRDDRRAAQERGRLERAIDEAARRLVMGEPGPEMRRRVLARIRRDATSRPAFLVPALAAAAAVAVVGSLVVHNQARPREPRSARAGTPPSHARSPAVATGRADAPAFEPPAVARSRPRLRERAGGSGPREEWASLSGREADLDIDPLPAPPPLTPAALPAVEVALGPIRIEETELAPLPAVEPLSTAFQEP
jgi:hypothetical protein